MNNVKAILFDSGRTLNVPRTGHWFITPNFMKIIDKLTTEFIDSKPSPLIIRLVFLA